MRASPWSRSASTSPWPGPWSWSTPPARRSTPAAAPADPAVREAAEAVAIMLSLVAPYTAEDMWARLGHEPSVALAGWPVVDPALLVEDSVTCVVQVAGKVRDRLEVPPTITRGRAAGAGAGRARRWSRRSRDATSARSSCGRRSSSTSFLRERTVESLTADEARLAALWAQGFVEPIDGASPATVGRMGHGPARGPGPRDAAAPRRRAARHHLRAGPLARAGRVRALRRDRPRGRRGRLLGVGPELRVLVARRLHPADGVVAAVRVPPAVLRATRHPLARGHPVRGARRDGSPARARAPRPPRTSAAPSAAASGGTGRSRRSPSSGCSTSARWSSPAASAGVASTTSPSGSSRRSCGPRSSTTRSACVALIADSRADAGRRHRGRHRRRAPAQDRRRPTPCGRCRPGAASRCRAGASRRGRVRRRSSGSAASAGAAPHDPAVAVRLAGLAPSAHRADLRPRAPARGLHARAQAGPRLLRDAGAPSGPAGRPRRPEAREGRPARPARHVRVDVAARPSRGTARALHEAASWVGADAGRRGAGRARRRRTPR